MVCVFVHCCRCLLVRQLQRNQQSVLVIPPIHSKNEDANNIYIDYYKNAVIIMERGVDLESLENTFILKVFKERTRTKLLNPSSDVYECIVKEFFAITFMEDDHINCWVQGKEFTISMELIQELLEIFLMTSDTFLHFDERKDKLEPLVQILEGQLKKKSLHTTNFSPEMRALAYIMIFNLYLVKNLTTLS